MHPQPGIFALGTPAHIHLQFDLTEPEAAIAVVGEFLAGLSTVAGVNVVVGLRPGLLSAFDADAVPPDAADFTVIESNGVILPADQHDLWVWLHGAGPGDCFAVARSLTGALAPSATLASEDNGFAYGAGQDLTGFEDGTENPPVNEAVHLIGAPADGPGAGASIALFQRWVHDLDKFGELATTEQEQVFGRTRSGSEEIPDESRSERAHISRVVIEDDHGEELEVFRRSIPFGTQRERGLLFVGFAPDGRLHTMLEAMVGADDGITDHLTEFSRCSGSATYVVPPTQVLDELTRA